MDQSNKKLGVIALSAIVVSAMIGGGIFSLPQNMAQSASVYAVIVAWLITGIGMYFIANTFRILADAEPDATTGIYSYARLGFGRFAGFEMAWAYWLCNIFGNVGYAVLLMDAFNYFAPGVFTGGNNIWSIIGGSCVIWLMNFAVLRGVKQAAFINIVGTICKLVPISIFIIIMLIVFKLKFFTTDMSGVETIVADNLKPLGSFGSQIKSTMLVTLWAFIGIEGAVVLSNRAKSQKAVGKATLIGFIGCLSIYAALSILPFGRMYQSELANLANPSTAPLLESVVGSWGGDLMNIGVIIALLSSWLAFTLMIVQIPYAAAMDGTFPKVFRKESDAGTPTFSLWTSSILMQVFMILVYFSNNAWNTMLSITSVMILPPYFACTLFLWKLCKTKKFPKGIGINAKFAFICGVAGSLYAIWMIYAAGIKYLVLAFIFQLISIPIYLWASREQRDDDLKANRALTPIFSKGEFVGMVLLVVIAFAAIFLLAIGKIKI